MKKQITFLILLFSSICFGQIEYSIELSPGLFFPNSHNFKLGYGGLITITAQPSEYVVFTLSNGYSNWGYRNEEEYNTRVIPIILGVRYKIPSEFISPYFLSEFQYVLGEVDYRLPSDITKPVLDGEKRSYKISEYGIGFGLGIMVPITTKLGIDIGSGILLTAKTSNIYNIRTMLGAYYKL